MFSRIVGEIPTWMHADDVAFRQELARYATPLTGQQRIWRVVRWVLLLSGLVLVGTGIASVGLTQRAGETITQAIWNSLYFPLLLMQAVASLNALVNIADTEQTTGVDDALKTTPLGIGLWLRARWLGGYLRMRPWLVFFVVGRLVMVGCLFIELIAMRGSYLDLIAQLKADPPISPVLAILLVALGVTASFVLPFTTLGLQMALSLWASYRFRDRTYALIVQLGLVASQWVALAGLAWLMARILNNQFLISLNGERLIFGGYMVFSDWGATFLNVTLSGEIWGRIPSTSWFSGVVMGVALLQVLLTEWILRQSIRQIETPD